MASSWCVAEGSWAALASSNRARVWRSKLHVWQHRQERLETLNDTQNDQEWHGAHMDASNVVKLSSDRIGNVLSNNEGMPCQQQSVWHSKLLDEWQAAWCC